MIGLSLFLSFVITVAITPLVQLLASSFGIVDEPNEERKVHREPIPLLGGLAIVLTVSVGVIIFLLVSNQLTFGEITAMHYMAFLVGAGILILGGWLDDMLKLPARVTIWFPIMAAVIAILGGVEVTKLTNPMGGVLLLAPWQSDVLVFIWLMVMMYATKLLDGLDGLVSGVTSVGAFAIMMLSLTAAYLQLDVALFTAIGLGAFLGFLVWNWHPATVFLGEGGSTFAGYFLGILAVISGGKLAIALLALGVPLLDLLWTVVRRFRSKASVVKADRQHLHHQLLDRGWKHASIVLLYVGVALVFALSGLVLQSREKLFAVILLAGLTLVLIGILTKKKPTYET